MKFIISFFSLLFYAPLSADAAEIFFGAHNPSVGIESIFEVGVFLNTEGVAINAVEGKILFQDDLVRLTEVRDGGSLVSLWIQKPEAGLPSEALAKEGKLSFSGLVPGGFTGEDGYLFSLFFEAKQKGQARITAVDEQILLADGQGSKAIVKKAPLVFDVVREARAVNELMPLEDAIPPESFSPQVSRDASIFEGKWFLVFAAQDKGFGVSHYEVQEGAGAWEKAASPYLLKDQNLRSPIGVKAVDKAGNERVETLEPRPGTWYENYLIWIIMIGITIFAVLSGRILWRKKTQGEK